MPCGHQCLCDGKECAEIIFERQECPMLYAELNELIEADEAVALRIHH
jgi:hypothetical protein